MIPKPCRQRISSGRLSSRDRVRPGDPLENLTAVRTRYPGDPGPFYGILRALSTHRAHPSWTVNRVGRYRFRWSRPPRKIQRNSNASNGTITT